MSKSPHSLKIPVPFLPGLRCLAHIVTLVVALVLLISFVVTSGRVSHAEINSTDLKANDEVFVIYRNALGESTCRLATAEERRKLLRRDRAGVGRTIYFGDRKMPVKDSGQTTNQVTTATGLQLLPSAGLHIVLHATQQLESNQLARDAFIVAANRWEALISTPITVVLDVDFGTTFFGEPFSNTNVLGATVSARQDEQLSNVRQQLISNAPEADELQLYNALPVSSVPVELNGTTSSTSTVRMTWANARALGLRADITDPLSIPLGQGDAGIGFNSTHPFDFAPENGIDTGSLDFDSVVVHEIGHALGFISNSGNNVDSPVSVWDVFRFRPGTANVGTMATAPRVMSEGTSTTDPQIFFNNRTNSFGTTELELSTGGSDGNGGDGRQSSHWKDDTFTPFIGIMDPRLPSGRREQITSNDVNAIDSFGYKIGGTAPPPTIPTPPPNDNFSAAVLLNGPVGFIAGTNFGATGQPGEPDHAAATTSGRRSVWYTWTAPTTGQMNFNTRGSNYDTVLGVYIGTSVDALQAVAANDDVEIGVITHSSVIFEVVAGTTYRIAVDGWEGSTGRFVLNWLVTNATSSALEFSIGNVTANESSGSVSVTVTRTGIADVIVSYATSDTAGLTNCSVFTGSASSRCDYATSIGTLRFTAGVDSKTISVPIVDDSYPDGNEIFTLTLTGGTGATLDSSGSVIITITDSDVNGPNPIDQTAFFVRQHYIDFLGREPDPPGFAAWQDVINKCPPGDTTCDRVHVSSAFYRSPEFQERGYFVYRFYEAAFGRKPDNLEFMPDLAKVSGFLSEAELEAQKVAFIQEFMSRPAFANTYNALGDAAYVDQLLMTAGLPGHPGRIPWRDALQAGTKTRAQVLREIVESAEVFDRFFNRAFVVMQYFGYLRRDPDALFVDWIKVLDTSGDFRGMVNGFVNSTEYRLRFGP